MTRRLGGGRLLGMGLGIGLGLGIGRLRLARAALHSPGSQAPIV